MKRKNEVYIKPKCNKCGCEHSSVSMVVDPYTLDIDDVKVKVLLCSVCYNELVESV